MSPAVTTGGALRPECWPLPPPPSALGQPWTRAPGGGRDRWLRARRDVLSDTTLSSSRRRLRKPRRARGSGRTAWLGCVAALRRGPEGGDGARPSCHLPQQVPGPPAPAPRPLAPGLLPGSCEGKHSLTGNFWESASVLPTSPPGCGHGARGGSRVALHTRHLPRSPRPPSPPLASTPGFGSSLLLELLTLELLT